VCGSSQRLHFTANIKMLPALKVPRLCPLVLVKVRLKERKIFGRHEGKGFGTGVY
jgi:hypothetical protein